MDQDTPQPWRSLYRRFRPQRFDELRGQDHVALALRNAVREDRVSHAYLFSGPRGTGKTSSARILAKALNCENVTDGEPCNECESCLSITRGASFDVHELDAASNNGVEAMRDLVARAALSTPGRWKVYIVDEVHMLSTSASNALLKTLEEPPPHVVFVLATTDPQKVLPTIRSRTQHFEFRLIAEENLVSLLSDVASEAGLDLPEGAIEVAVRRGRGSARDALSVLDQVAAAGITDDSTPAIGELVAALAYRDTARAFSAVGQALADGRDVHRLTVELVEALRRGFLMIAAPANAARLDITEGSTEALEADVRELGIVRCVRSIEVLGATQVDMRTSADPRITLEVALARLTHPEADDSTAAILERVQRLERRIAQLTTTEAAPAGGAGGGAGTTNVLPAEQEKTAPASDEKPALGAFQARQGRPLAPAPQAPKVEAPVPVVEVAVPVEVPAAVRPLPSRDDVVAAWGDKVLVTLQPRARARFQAGRFVAMEDDVAVMALPNESHRVAAQSVSGDVAAALTAHFGRPIRVRLVADGGSPAGGEGPGEEPSLPEPRGLDGDFDLIEEMADAGQWAHRAPPDSGVSWAKERLLEAFPGAQEVEGT